MTNPYESPQGTDRPVAAHVARPRRALVAGLAAITAGVVLFYSQYGEQSWGNWLHSRSFNLGLLCLTFGVAAIVGSRFSWKAGFIVAAAILVNIWWWLWTYPGWLILHHFIYRLFPH